MLENHEEQTVADFAPPGRWSATRVLLGLNAVLFVAQWFVQTRFPRFPLEDYLGLSLPGLLNGHVWQLLTYQFLHGGLLHLLLNLWGIYIFGQVVEHALGWRRFLTMYLFCGICGGLLHVIGGLFFPTHFGVIRFGLFQVYQPVVGASAGLFGLIAAFAALYPEQDLKVFLFFFLPVTVGARVLLWVSAGLAVVGMWLAGDNVAHGAHLGGMIAGYLYASGQPPGPPKKPVENHPARH